MLLLIVFAGNAGAQEFKPCEISGNTYTCYFLTPLDIVSNNITFGEIGGMTFSSFAGNGFYVNITNLFLGAYWSLNASLGNTSGDIIFLLSGLEFDPFIVFYCIA